MKRGDVVKMKESAALSAAVAWASEEVEEVAHPGVVGTAAWAMRVGVIIEVIEDVEPAGDQCVVYWSDNIKSTHWETDLEMK
jgi:hypothetical protein